MAGDPSSVPPQECVWRDEPALASWAGERGGDGAEQGSIRVVDFGSVDLAADDGELVAEHDDLEVFGTTRADRETGEHGDEAVEDTGHSWSASAAFALISAHDRIFGPHRPPGHHDFGLNSPLRHTCEYTPASDPADRVPAHCRRGEVGGQQSAMASSAAQIC